MKKLLVLLLILFLYNCSNIEEGEEVLYLETPTSTLPIYVRGNADADTYIIWTHGGPGSSGLYYGDIPEIEQLHTNYRVVYWDQLGSGGSTGDPSESDYTVENFSTHQEGIVNIIKNRYNPKNLYILGHSWGGFLVSYYLIANGDATLQNKRQSEITGTILLNPILDIKESIEESISYVISYAEQKIIDNDDKDKWEEALVWYEDNVVDGIIVGQNIAIHYGYIEDTGGMLVELDRNDELTAELGPLIIFMSPFTFYDYYNNQSTIRTYLDIADKSLYYNDNDLSNITTPILFIAGESDKIANIDQSTKWSAQIGTPVAYKTFNVYPDCAHAAFLDKPDDFYNDVVQFISENDSP
ncbi:MAG: alpha/beta hydrolase [Spirochaetaceae bacterium]